MRLRWDMLDLKAASARPAGEERGHCGPPLRDPNCGPSASCNRPTREWPTCLSPNAGTAHRACGASHRRPGRGHRWVALPVHPYAAACVWVLLANKGVDTRALQQYLGHRNIQHTVRYTEFDPAAVFRTLGGLRTQIGLNCSDPVTGPNFEPLPIEREIV